MSKNENSFKYFTDEESQNYLAQAMPKGKLTANRFDSTSELYKMLLCLATSTKYLSGLAYKLAKNINIDKADELIEEWETSAKIPEEIPRLTALEDRRAAVKRIISKYPVFQLADYTSFDVDTTYEEFIRLLTGLIVEIERATDRAPTNGFPIPFPIVFDIELGHRNFLYYIKVEVEGEAANNQFPLPFPVSFFDPAIPEATKGLLIKVLSLIFPANAGWVFEVKPV